MSHSTPVLLSALLLGALAGAGAGYVAALWSPAPARIAVIDVERAARAVLDGKPQDPKAASGAVAARIQARARELAEYGLIVLDAKGVLDAPEDLYVPLDDAP